VPRDLDPPRIGISRCLLGDEVRYDGGHKLDADLVSSFGPLVEWVSVCPEVEVGMSVPREPIHLVAHRDGVQAGSVRVRLVGLDSGEDWTNRMAEWARDRVRELSAMRLSGYVLKSRSPSCGLRDVLVKANASWPDRRQTETVVDERSRGAGIQPARGLFAEALIGAMPDLPVEDDERLRDPEIRRQFFERVRTYQREHER